MAQKKNRTILGEDQVALYDLIVRNGTIIDGTQVPRYAGDIAIRDGVIERIGNGLGDADNVIDAAGKIVAPGVVDLHTHYDAQLHWDPYCTNSGWHGTTTVAIGNCGFGYAPCRPSDRGRYMQMMENTEQIPLNVQSQALPWTWESFPEWMSHLRALPKGVNVAAFVPLNPLMIYVMGVDAAKTRPATSAERQTMKDLLEEAMDAGAIGMGFSYQGEKNGHTDFDGTPMPTDCMDPEEAYSLSEVLKARGEGIIQVLADMPGCSINRGIIEGLAERSGRPILHNIMQLVESDAGYHQGILKFLDDMAAKGHSVFTHAMSMHTWTEFNFVDFNFWDGVGPTYKEFSQAGDAPGKLALARDPSFRARFKAAYRPEDLEGVVGGAFETFKLLDAGGAPTYADREGRLLGEIAREKGVDIIDLFFDLFIQSEGRAEVRTTQLGVSDPKLLAGALRHPRVLYGASDGGAHVKFWSGGQFSTDILTWLGRDEDLIPLEEIHYRLSYLPSRFAGFRNRGALLEGYAADLMVYDLGNLGCSLDRFEIVRDLPDGSARRAVYARGIEAVVVNGQATFRNNQCLGGTPGRVL